MPQLPRYSYTGPVNHRIPADESKLVGKSVIITGGANGIGEQLVRQFAAADAYVTFGDTNDARGRQLEAELNESCRRVMFVRCNISEWDDQVRMFEKAIEASPNRSCDIVVANAGISRSSGDSLWKLDGKLYALEYLSNQLTIRLHRSRGTTDQARAEHSKCEPEWHALYFQACSPLLSKTVGHRRTR